MPARIPTDTFALTEEQFNSLLRLANLYRRQVLKLQISTYAGCYVLAKLGRPQFVVPQASEFLFTRPKGLLFDEIVSSYTVLYRARCSVP